MEKLPKKVFGCRQCCDPRIERTLFELWIIIALIAFIRSLSRAWFSVTLRADSWSTVQHTDYILETPLLTEKRFDSCTIEWENADSGRSDTNILHSSLIAWVVAAEGWSYRTTMEADLGYIENNW